MKNKIYFFYHTYLICYVITEIRWKNAIKMPDYEFLMAYVVENLMVKHCTFYILLSLQEKYFSS